MYMYTSLSLSIYIYRERETSYYTRLYYSSITS